MTSSAVRREVFSAFYPSAVVSDHDGVVEFGEQRGFAKNFHIQVLYRVVSHNRNKNKTVIDIRSKMQVLL